MLSENVKYRLSIAFDSTKDTIRVCRDIVIGSSIPPTDKSRILGDLGDVKNIIKQEKFGDVDAIEEAIVALGDTYARNLPGERRLKESLGYILQWLGYIKKTLEDEGLIPSSMEDIRAESYTNQSTYRSNYGYFDDSGTFISAGSMEGNHHSECSF